jgi:prevent-host-death family protein
MSAVSITQAKKDLQALIDRVLDGETVTITTKKGNVVMLSENEWGGIKETLYLMSDPDFMNDVREARSTPDSELEVWDRRTM